MSNIDDIELKIARLDLRPGDILVVKCAQAISQEAARRIHHIVMDVAPGHKALILDGGMDLAVLTVAEIEARSTAPTSDEAAVPKSEKIGA